MNVLIRYARPISDRTKKIAASHGENHNESGIKKINQNNIEQGCKATSTVHIEWKYDTTQNDFEFAISCIIEWLMFTNQFDRISYGRLHASLALNRTPFN